MEVDSRHPLTTAREVKCRDELVQMGYSMLAATRASYKYNGDLERALDLLNQPLPPNLTPPQHSPLNQPTLKSHPNTTPPPPTSNPITELGNKYLQAPVFDSKLNIQTLSPGDYIDVRDELGFWLGAQVSPMWVLLSLFLFIF